MNFHDRVVLITGASSGIGAACAQRFSRLGARVSILDAIAPTALDGALVTIGDINDPAVRTRAVATTLGRYGTIDILVNNVGIGLYKRASDNCPEQDLQVFTTNVFSAVAFSRLVILHMKSKRQGWIANVSSVGAYVGLPWSASYCASKSALHSYAESLRRELREYGIHVSTIVPGIVRTDFRDHVLAGHAPAGVVGIRRSVSADQVAACVIRSIAKRKNRIFIPWYGRIFTGLDFFMPGVMDAYIAGKWSAMDRTAEPDPGCAFERNQTCGDAKLSHIRE